MTTEAGTPGDLHAGPVFAHASEAEFARILDFYQVTWEYEPQVFPILWDLEGNVLESFAPDFFMRSSTVRLAPPRIACVARSPARADGCAAMARRASSNQ